MILVLLILVPLAGAAMALAVSGRSPVRARLAALATLLLQLSVLLAAVWVGPHEMAWSRPWIPRFGMSFALALDGLSLALALLTVVLGLAAVAVSWREITSREGLFHFHLLLVVAGATGVFLARDLFLFFLFWEAMLVPMYFLVALWGHRHRAAAAFKFFVFTQAGGLLMLTAFVFLALHYQSSAGALSFSLGSLTALPSAPGAGTDVMALLLFLAFAVKMPVVPLHTWLADAHTEAPTGGSILLAGVLLKTGAYGLMRVWVPLFPVTAVEAAPLVALLAVVGIFYGALAAFGQRDIKRVIAYSSISHMGFVLLGIAAWNTAGLQGATVQMIGHGLTTGALFAIAGMLQARLGTRRMELLGGLHESLPRLAAFALFFTVATLGLPGLVNFAGEFLVLLAAFDRLSWAAAVGAAGTVAAAVYALAWFQRTFEGAGGLRQVADADPRESAVLGALAVAVTLFGLYPAAVLEASGPAVEALQAAALESAHLAGALR